MQEHRPFPFKKLSFLDSTTVLTKYQTICRYWFMVEFVYPVYSAAARPLCLPSDWQSIFVMARRSFVCGVDAFHPVSIAIWWVNKSLLKNIKTLDLPAGLWWISQEVCYAPVHISHPLCSTPLCFASLKIHTFTYTMNHSKDSYSEFSSSLGELFPVKNQNGILYSFGFLLLFNLCFYSLFSPLSGLFTWNAISAFFHPINISIKHYT